VLALLVATAVTLLTLDFRHFGPLERAQQSLREVVEPVAGAFAAATSPVRNVWHGVADYGDVKAENNRLRDEVAKLRASNVGEANARDQLNTILAQKGITAPGGSATRLARVVSGPPSNFDNTIRIDKGADDGVVVNMTVVTDAGLVGRVKETTRSRAVVQLADTRGFAVGVRLVGGNAQTTFVARGQGPGQPLLLEGKIEPSFGLQDGTSLVTSGLDQSLYPPDVLVGRVVGSGRGPGAPATPSTVPGGQLAPQQGVAVGLFVDLRSLSYVTVLLWQPQS
jgi:rod shape-determining protein MreC